MGGQGRIGPGRLGRSVLEVWTMIQITPQMRIWLAVEPVDFRKGIDGLAQVCRQHLKVDPMAGALVIFSSRRRKALKCLVFDGQGFWLCQKGSRSENFRGGRPMRNRRPSGWTPINSSRCCGMPSPPVARLCRCGGPLRPRVDVCWVYSWAGRECCALASQVSVVEDCIVNLHEPICEQMVS